MAVRLNGLLKGGAGITPALAEMLAVLLNRGLHPRLPSIGSVGASDLCVLAHLGLALAGPRQYGGQLVDDHWMGDGRRAVTAEDLGRVLDLYLCAGALLVAAVCGGLLLAG
jgi:histidine ammonia-lyase